MATRTISPKGRTLLADMPAFYSQDPNALAAIDSTARELQRIEDLLGVIRTQAFPQNADDSYHILGLWERLLGLPVEPAVPLPVRRAGVLSAIRQRQSGSGKNWVARVSEVLGANVWNYDENDPGGYQISIVLPYQPTAITTLTGSTTLPTANINVTDASVLSVSGTVRIGNQFVLYTSKSGNTLQGCTGGTGTWPGGTQVTQGTQYTVGQAGILLRAITPAHIEIFLGYTGGFKVDMDRVDMDPL